MEVDLVEGLVGYSLFCVGLDRRPRNGLMKLSLRDKVEEAAIVTYRHYQAIKRTCGPAAKVGDYGRRISRGPQLGPRFGYIYPEQCPKKMRMHDGEKAVAYKIATSCVFRKGKLLFVPYQFI